jgi:signal peptidase II
VARSQQVGWQLIYNPGGAFGIPAPHWLFLIVTVGVVVLVARVLPKAPTADAATAYGMLLAGAVGNVLDRLLRPGGDGLRHGYVVDFVAWGSFPRFNVADSAITVGFVLLVLALLREERRAVVEQAGADHAPGPVAEPAPADPELPDEDLGPRDGDAGPWDDDPEPPGDDPEPRGDDRGGEDGPEAGA